MIQRDNILIAIGRAYAQPRNAEKDMDPDLASDIADAIALLTDRDAPTPTGPARRTRGPNRKPFAVRHECCGSRGVKHRKTCDRDEAVHQRSRDRAEALKRITEMACEECGHPFRSNLPLENAKCPDCGSKNVRESNEPPVKTTKDHGQTAAEKTN